MTGKEHKDDPVQPVVSGNKPGDNTGPCLLCHHRCSAVFQCNKIIQLRAKQRKKKNLKQRL